jgi:hypothetical protein
MSTLQKGLLGLGLLVLAWVGGQFLWRVYVPRWRQAMAQGARRREWRLSSAADAASSATLVRQEPSWIPPRVPTPPPPDSHANGSSPTQASALATGLTEPASHADANANANADSRAIPSSESADTPGLAQASEPLDPFQAQQAAPSPHMAQASDTSAGLPQGAPERVLTNLERVFPPPLALDTVLDMVVPIALSEPLPGARVLAALPKTARIGSKRYAIEGKNQHTSAWEFPVRDQQYVALRAGMQRANRTGPMNAVEFSDFTLKTQAFVQTLQITPDSVHMEFPPMQKALQYARALDQFAQSHDAYLAVLVRAPRGQSWTVAQLQRQAHQLGFVPGAWPGRMVWTGELGNHPWLVLQFDSHLAFEEEAERQAARLSVFEIGLSASQVPRQAKALERLHDSAHALAQVLGGRLSDEQGRDITPQHWPTIAAQLEHLYKELDEAGMPAGSPLALRLFTG